MFNYDVYQIISLNVSISIVNLVSARILNEKRDINGVYEDRMVYVKSQAIIPRKPRGRPKKSVLENNSVTPVLKSSTSDVIFLPPVKNGHKALSITHTQHNKDPTLFSQIPLRQNAQSKTNSHSHTALELSMLNSCNFRSVSGTNLYNRTILGAKPQKIPRSNNMQYQTMFRSNPFSHIAFGSNYHPQSLLRTCLLEPGFPSQAATPVMEATPEAISKPVSTNQREVSYIFSKLKC